MKFLGVVLDHKISWKPHITKLAKTIAILAKTIAILGKARYILDYNSLYTLYKTLILPYLIYCVKIWGNTYKTNLQPLCTLRKRAIRVINNVGYLEHTNVLFLKSHILKFIDLVTFKTAQIMYRARHNLLPRKLKTLFVDREGGYNLRGNLHFKQLKVRTTLRSMTICGVI